MKGYIEKIEDGVAAQLQPGFFAKGFAAATNSIVEALDRRRGFCDEMEKLIGVRQLDKHPDGINGGVIALLGITDKLAPESAARWKDFVIAELLHYVKGVGTTEELMDTIDAKQKALVAQMAESWGNYTTALGSLDVVQIAKDNPSKYLGSAAFKPGYLG
ncbi:hypothetical protein D3C79_50060 [compost metagenome]